MALINRSKKGFFGVNGGRFNGSERVARSRDAIAVSASGGASALQTVGGYSLVPKDWTADIAIREGMRSSVWVYVCVMKLAKSFASVPWVVQILNEAEEWVYAPSHPLSALMNRPNPKIGRVDLFMRFIMHRYLSGNALLVKVRDDLGRTTELWPISPDVVTPVAHPSAFISHYKLSSSAAALSGVELIDYADVVHNRIPDPANPYWGLSPMQAGTNSIETDVDASAWNRSTFRNRAVPDGILSIKGPVTQEKFDHLKTQLRRDHMGPSKARSAFLTDGEVNWVPLSQTPVDMDHFNTRRMSREEICAIFGVPLHMAGAVDNSTYNNLAEAKLSFWLDTMIPLLDDVSNTFNDSLASEWGSNVRIHYDHSKVHALKKILMDYSMTVQQYVAAGLPLNTVVSTLGLDFPPVSGGDIGRVQSSTIPATLDE